MRNLLERATPELKKAIEDYSAAYSFTAESVKKDLEANTGVSYLNYLTVCRLADIAKFAGIEFRFENPWVHFLKD